ncbi:nucleotide exchange factor GrpE [Lacimicrobium sp. SS2-24]|uniref:nucleotide exchange factor GrpE n=1 Tax=Lacimicrobium sp. SS2-24 TaxID=2005569 RepID=UPI000B4BFA02|nr:nucleotide exchange factor GrpE [Lacimicrobium sp. SS2-24]
MSNEQQPKQDEQQPEAENQQDTQAEHSSQEEVANSEEQQRIAELEASLAQAEATIRDQKDAVLRARADADNARKRAEAEIDKARKFALERFAGELLSVIDNLERALQVADASNEAVKPLIEGVELTHKSFIATIEKFGMQVVDPQGEAFNPDLHQAMSMQESADVEPNSVLAVMQKGYQLNGRLLRPAMVMVSRAPEAGVDTEA